MNIYFDAELIIRSVLNISLIIFLIVLMRSVLKGIKILDKNEKRILEEKEEPYEDESNTSKAVNSIVNGKLVDGLIIKYTTMTEYNKDLMSNFKYDEASCFDIQAAEDKVIKSGKDELIETGLIIDIPKEYEIQIRPRSGFSRDKKTITNFGTIDSDYRGSIKVHMFNFNLNDVEIYAGDRIAQCYICKKSFFPGKDVLVNVKTVEEFDRPVTKRNKVGFGSSGI